MKSGFFFRARVKSLLYGIATAAMLALPAVSFAKSAKPECPYELEKITLSPGLEMYTTPFFEWYDAIGSDNPFCRGAVSCLKYKNVSKVLVFSIKKDDSELSENLERLIRYLSPDRIVRSDSFSISLKSDDNSKDIYTNDKMVGNDVYSLVQSSWNDVDEDEVFTITLPLQACRMPDINSMGKIWNYIKSTPTIEKIRLAFYYGIGDLTIEIPITFPLHSIVSLIDYEMKH